MYGGIVKERSHGQYYCYVVNIIVNIIVKLLNIVLTIFIDDRLEALLRMIILRILNIDNNIDRLNVP